MTEFPYWGLCGVLICVSLALRQAIKHELTTLPYLDGNKYIFQCKHTRRKKTRSSSPCRNLKLCQRSRKLEAILTYSGAVFPTYQPTQPCSPLPLKWKTGDKRGSGDIMRDQVSSSPLLCLHKAARRGCVYTDKRARSTREHQTPTRNVCCWGSDCSHYLLAVQTPRISRWCSS